MGKEKNLRGGGRLVQVAEDGMVRSVVVAHVDPAKVEWAKELREHPRRPRRGKVGGAGRSRGGPCRGWRRPRHPAGESRPRA